jgi:hypothetical protein
MWIEKIVQDIRRGENIDVYATIVVTLALVVLEVLEVISQDLLISTTLGVLTMIAIMNLANRNKLELINEKLKNDRQELNEKFPSRFTHHIENASELWLTGVHHSSIMTEYYHSFEKMLNQGGSLKVIVVDPDGAACEMTAMRFAGHVHPEQERTRTRANLEILQQLAKSAPERVEIRIIDYLFEYNAFLIDPYSSDGIVYVQRYTFKIMGGARKPKFVYRPKDGRWYDLIRSEVLAIWEHSVPWYPTS